MTLSECQTRFGVSRRSVNLSLDATDITAEEQSLAEEVKHDS